MIDGGKISAKEKGEIRISRILMDNFKDHALSVGARSRGRVQRPCSRGFLAAEWVSKRDTKARLERLLSSVIGNTKQVSNVSLPGGGIQWKRCGKTASSRSG